MKDETVYRINDSHHLEHCSEKDLPNIKALSEFLVLQAKTIQAFIKASNHLGTVIKLDYFNK